jgi:predicted type IV restriction endonuclease
MGFEPTLCIIDLNKNDIQKTVNYLLKLNNHSNKITTKNRIRIVKNGQYKYLAMLTGFEATKAEKVAKKSMVDNM